MKTPATVRGLTSKEFKKIMNRIYKKHWLVKGRYVKYVDTSFDFRTLEFWRVVIRPFGQRKEFNTSNRFDNPKHDNLYDEIIEWLEEVENASKR